MPKNPKKKTKQKKEIKTDDILAGLGDIAGLNNFSIKDVLDDLFEAFPFPELKDLLGQLSDPMKAGDTSELLDMIESNIDFLKEREEFVKQNMGAPTDENRVKSYVENPSNFTEKQWAALEKTRLAMHKYERAVDTAMESGKIRVVLIENREKTRDKNKKKKIQRFKKRKKWISM